MAADDYDAQKFINAQSVLKRVLVQLQEHFEDIEITCAATDSQGAVFSTTINWSEDGDDDDEEGADA